MLGLNVESSMLGVERCPQPMNFAEIALPGARPGQIPGWQLSRSECCATDPGWPAGQNRKPATVRRPISAHELF
jgi:hypothetical protein